MSNSEIRNQDKGGLPAYMQVKQSVQEYISRHRLVPGDKIPTEAELCRELGWSRVTINRALKEMAWDGILDRVQGSGTYVARPKLDATRKYRIMVSSCPLSDGDDYLGPLFAGIREEAADLGLDINYYFKSPIPEAEVVARLDVDGILCLAIQSDDQPRILNLHSQGIPVVGMGQRSRIGSLPVICTDNYSGMSEIMRYLLGLGHKRIACITSGAGTSDVHERCMAFHNTLCEANLQVDPSYLLLTNNPMSQTSLEHWFDGLSSPPTAILVSSWSAASIYGLLARKGISIPKDISVIGFDDPESASRLATSLTVLYQPIYEMGRRGLAKLVAMIKGQDSGEPEIIPTRLILRESVSVVKDTVPEDRDLVFENGDLHGGELAISRF